MKKIYFLIFLFIEFSALSQQSNSNNHDSLYIVLKEVLKELKEIKNNQGNLVSKEQCQELKEKKEIECKAFKELSEKRADSIEIKNNKINELNALLNQINKNFETLRDTVKNKEKEINSLYTQIKQIQVKSEDLDYFVEYYRTYLKTAPFLDSNLINSLNHLKSAKNFSALDSELKEFYKIQSSLFLIENRMQNEEFVQFNDVIKDLNLLNINSKLLGLYNRKEIIKSDINECKSLYNGLKKKIKDLQQIFSKQDKFNFEFLPYVSNQRSLFSETFKKYSSISYQIDLVFKDSKHVLPTIN
jgi:chromosome segregation ATPase